MSKSKGGKLFGQQRGAAWIFLAPALSLIAVFFFLPVLAGLLLSFTDFDLYSIGAPRTARFVGLSNYQALLGDSEFWQALRNTLYFVARGRAAVGGRLPGRRPAADARLACACAACSAPSTSRPW